MSAREATAFVVVASALFVFAAWRLNPLCFALSPVALAIVFWYSLAKRFTTWTQLFLGLAMAVAPVGGWLAVGGRGGLEPWLLALAIGTWVGGFDVLYACQDLEFDRAHGLRSIPVRFGVPAALAISRAMHVVDDRVPRWRWRGSRRCPPFYFAGVGVGGRCCSCTSSRSSRADDLSQVKRAFDLNGYVGILYLLVLAAVDLCPLTARRSVAVAITGASGALYAMRTLAALLGAGGSRRARRLRLRPAPAARRARRDGDASNVCGRTSSGSTAAEVEAGTINVHSNRDLGATIASGSHGCAGHGDRAVLDEDAGRRRARPVAQSRRARRRRDAEGAAAARSSCRARRR